MIVGWLAYRGARNGVRQSIDDAQRARAQEITVEHARWLRDRRAETYEAIAVDIIGRVVERDIGMRHQPVGMLRSHVPSALMPIDVAFARIHLYGTDESRQLLEACARINQRVAELHGKGVRSDDFDRVLDDAKRVDMMFVAYLTAETAQSAIADAPAKYDLPYILTVFDAAADALVGKLATM
jgi:hypothetical protein